MIALLSFKMKKLQIINLFLLIVFILFTLISIFEFGDLFELSDDAIITGYIPLFSITLSIIFIFYSIKFFKNTKLIKISLWISIISVILFFMLNILFWVPCLLKNNCSGFEFLGTAITILFTTCFILTSFIIYLVGINNK